jgi:hypothetical protein
MYIKDGIRRGLTYPPIMTLVECNQIEVGVFHVFSVLVTAAIDFNGLFEAVFCVFVFFLRRNDVELLCGSIRSKRTSWKCNSDWLFVILASSFFTWLYRFSMSASTASSSGVSGVAVKKCQHCFTELIQI